MTLNLLQNIVQEIKESRKKRDDPEPQSYIEAYLDEVDKAKGTNPNFSEECLNVVLQDLFLAGGETTSTTLGWAFLLFAKFPEVQDKVYEEIVKVIGLDKEIQLEDDMR